MRSTPALRPSPATALPAVRRCGAVPPPLSARRAAIVVPRADPVTDTVAKAADFTKLDEACLTCVMLGC